MSSATVPGWGQIRAGRRRLGAGLACATLVLLLTLAAALVAEGALGVVGWLLDPDFLLALLLANLLFALGRVWATAHAWRAAGGRLASLLLAAILVLVLAPHAALAYYGLKTRSMLVAVFPPGEVPEMAAAEATGSTETEVASTTFESTTTTVRHRSPLPSDAGPTSTTSATPAANPLGERFTVLLLGGDAGPGRPGLRTDSMMVVTIDTATGDAALFGLPRNMAGFTFSDGTPFPGPDRGLLNEVYQWGLRYPERFPGIDPGAAAVADVASYLLGIPIEHFVLVDMVGFAEMVDALGGVTLDVPRAITVPLYHRDTGGHTMVTIPAGPRWLDGDHALAYARSRTGSSDYARMARQRCLLSALVAEMEPLDVFARLPALLDTIERNVTTDIPLSAIPYLVNLAPAIDPDRVVVVGFDRAYRAGYSVDGLGIPDVAKIQATVRAALDGRHSEVGLDTAGPACR